jgi:molybdopterin-guanine dinucleotide biosynthesis protein
VRQRALIHIGGPSGAGKTTLAEAVIAHAGEDVIIAARCRCDESLTEPCESYSTTDPELGRYLAAGADAAARYSFPDTDDVHDAFFMTNLMEHYSDAVILEGDSPLGYADLAVQVAPASGGRLLVRRKETTAHQERAVVDALEAVLNQPSGMHALVGRLLGDTVAGVALRFPEVVEQHRQRALTDLERVRKTPVPKARMRWAVAGEYRGVERAQLVVINIRGQAERAAGEALLAEVARLRSDRAVFDDVASGGVSRVPITAVVADLTDPRDPGMKKALTRIRRAVRAANR